MYKRQVQASSALVEYALDPRNFLNADNIFMFENLSFDSSLQDESGLESMVAVSYTHLSYRCSYEE